MITYIQLINVVMYANDAIILFECTEGVLTLLNRIKARTLETKLTLIILNVSLSAADFVINLHINKRIVETVESRTYLGSNITNKPVIGICIELY